MRDRTCRAAAALCALLAAALAILFASGAALAAWEHHIAANAGARATETAQTLLAAALAENPALETALIDALQEGDPGMRARGETVLARYGYAEGLPPGVGSRALRPGAPLRRVFVFSGIAAAALAGSLAILFKHRKEEQMRAIVEAYLAEDYSFAQSNIPFGRRSLEGSANRLGEAVRRLGGQIRVKNEHIEQERIRTQELVTDISHQIKTPLAALRTCFELLAEDGSAQEREEFLGRCRAQIASLEALTDTLMQVSRLETAMITLRPVPVALADVLLTAVNGVYSRARKKGIQIELAPFEHPPLTLDARWTAEAVLNVLDNAVKYSPPGSCVKIRVHTLMTFVRIEIEDGGIGIPRSECARIFRRFYRGASPAVQKLEGSGVGLYLTRRILEEQGGTISVRSVPGSGSVFSLQLRR